MISQAIFINIRQFLFASCNTVNCFLVCNDHLMRWNFANNFNSLSIGPDTLNRPAPAQCSMADKGVLYTPLDDDNGILTGGFRFPYLNHQDHCVSNPQFQKKMFPTVNSNNCSSYLELSFEYRLSLDVTVAPGFSIARDEL